MKVAEDAFTQIPDLKELLDFTGSQATKQLAGTHGALTQAGVTKILELCEALWLHSGDPKAPHAELTSGKCSDGFVDVLRALRYTNVCDILAYHMTHAIEAKGGEIDNNDEANAMSYSSLGWVIGSDHAGAVFSHDVARWLGAKHDFTEKSGPDGKQQIWKRFAISSGETVLQVEELMTTAQTLMAVREGIRKGNPIPVRFAPVVGVLVHRSDVYEIEGAPVVYLAHYDISVWNPEECPLCAAGSKRLRPKQNWAELTRKT
jgi:orotate phosphoribosyltransferase